MLTNVIYCMAKLQQSTKDPLEMALVDIFERTVCSVSLQKHQGVISQSKTTSSEHPLYTTYSMVALWQIQILFPSCVMINQ